MQPHNRTAISRFQHFTTPHKHIDITHNFPRKLQRFALLVNDPPLAFRSSHDRQHPPNTGL
jgi:hypothetical protein